MTTLELTKAQRETRKQLEAAPPNSLVISRKTQDELRALCARTDLSFVHTTLLDDSQKQARRALVVGYGAIVVDHDQKLSVGQTENLLGLAMALQCSIRNKVPQDISQEINPKLMADVIPWRFNGTGLIIRTAEGKELLRLQAHHQLSDLPQQDVMALLETLSRKIEERPAIAPVLPQHKL